MSKSLARWLASRRWNIALISRSVQNRSAIASEVREAQKSPPRPKFSTARSEDHTRGQSGHRLDGLSRAIGVAFYDRIPRVIRLPSSGLGGPVAVHLHYLQYGPAYLLYCPKTLAEPNGRRVSITTAGTSYSIPPFIARQATPAQTDDQRGAGCTHLAECTRSAGTLTAIVKEA
ncbi:hypothetical protein BP00DRAFT_442669 [Aspergillus indologenus CBS 114.80]|uniref:Uncharacterized protein n=1 Tax=Aspergillus indologenus CBS 114.80 TaxID=1450541 RepID=A0A2V5JAG7_9EURO|nr:hypothetical protein BP00DRAFT_442669 [Aspergillus indologenus CBS 114.80]